MKNTIESIQSELKLYYQRHEDIVKMLGQINTEIRSLEDELKELDKKRDQVHQLIEKKNSQSPFDSAKSMSNMLGLDKLYPKD